MSTFTPAQAAAIAARGNVLVIAGAGTGKTRTLIERCLQLLRDGAALDQMLLVTFTEAAAAELRARLRKALEEELKAATSLRAPDPRASVLDCGGPPPLSDAHDAQEHQRTDALQKLAERPTMPMETAPSANPSASEPTAPFPIPHSLSPSPADLLAEHLALLDTAQISTLHSFCLRLVREHFHHLAIDPQLVILDERQTRPLARACLTDLLAEHYAGRHPHSSAVQQLLRRAGRGSDEPLRALVWQLHRYTQTLPDPDAWCAAQLAAFRDPAPAQWQTWLHEALADWRAEWLPALAAAPAVPALKQAAAALQDLAELRPTQASTAAHTALSALLAADATDNWKRKKTELRPPFAKLFDEAAFFHALLAPSSSSHSLSPIPHPPSPSSALTEDWEWSRHEMAALIQLTRQSTENFSEAKRQLGGVDFADLEQFALRLLRDETTGVARQCRARFTHVCVDEYQDINAAQDAILRAVSGTGAAANRFLVGDLKQSIYRFRLANPRIFASYAKAWRSPVGRDSVEPHLERSEASAASIPGRDTLRQDTRSTCASPVGQCGSTESHPTAEVIALAENFRSREAILDFVNPLFRALMRESIGGVAYDADAELKFGNPAGRAALRSPVPAASSHVELHLLTNDATEDEPTDATTDLLDLLAVEREARCVALRLHALHASGHEIRDDATKPPRPVEWRDMVVLMRSPGSRVESFAQEFHRIGVPLHAARGGFYEALEVSDLLNLLRLLDNPLQDLPLLAVLRSPLVAMSLEDLVALRASSDERLFWDALVKAARTPTSAAARGDGADTNAAALPPHPSPLPPGEGASPDAPRSLGAPGSEPAIAVGPPNSEPASPTPPLSNILPLPAGEGRGEGERSQPPSAPSTPTAAPLFTSHSSPLTKAFSFLARFTAWRELLRLSSLTQCLERVLAETHYESLLLAEPRGAERVANVRRLLDLARQFDPYQRQGLHRFLQFIAAQEEAELDHAPAPAPTDNAVRLMSIHQSKGLEFPVVVVAGLGTMFNERDLRGDILLDDEFGLCPMVAPPGRERRYASLPHWLAQRRGRRELLGEELRLLYVALTRARDTLLLVGTATGKDVAEKWRGPTTPLDDRTLLKARRPLDWLRLWLPSVTSEDDWRGDAAGQNALLSWQLYAADDERLIQAGDSSAAEPAMVGRGVLTPPSAAQTPQHLGGALGTARPTSASLSALELNSLHAKLEWQYPHTPATHELAKTSVTVLRRRAAEAEECEAATPFAPRYSASAPRHPSGLTATQVGLAHHAFLQCVDLARTATALDLRNEATRLTEAGVLTERDAAALDFSALLTFWESPVGQLVRANASRVQREVPFTARFKVDALAAMGLGGSQKSEVRSQEPVQAARAECELPTSEPRSTPSPFLRGREREPDSVRQPSAPSLDPRPQTPDPSSPNPEAEFVIVQGVADLVVFRPQEIWLLDYKTDHFDEAELPRKVREHGPQLSLYAEALEQIYRRKVTRTWLHFLALGRTELL